jgi:hypothetical protein
VDIDDIVHVAVLVEIGGGRLKGLGEHLAIRRRF